jgi:hypothetical protein
MLTIMMPITLSPYRSLGFCAGIIQRAAWLYCSFSFSLQEVELVLAIMLSYRGGGAPRQSTGSSEPAEGFASRALGIAAGKLRRYMSEKRDISPGIGRLPLSQQPC